MRNITLVMGLLLVGGCSLFLPPQIVLHPIEKSDIFAINKGDKVGTIVVEKDGWFLSDLYLEQVADAKVKK